MDAVPFLDWRPQRRGQAAITDLFIAIAVFIVLVTITTLLWNLYNARLDSRLDYDTMVLKAYHIVDGFLRSPGFPEHWEDNPTSAKMIGLVSSDHVLDEEKVGAFTGLQENVTKDIMKIALYNYYFVIHDAKNNNIFVAGTVPQGTFAVNLIRPVLYQGTPHTLEFAVWKE